MLWLRPSVSGLCCQSIADCSSLSPMFGGSSGVEGETVSGLEPYPSPSKETEGGLHAGRLVQAFNMRRLPVRLSRLRPLPTCTLLSCWRAGSPASICSDGSLALAASQDSGVFVKTCPDLRPNTARAAGSRASGRSVRDFLKLQRPVQSRSRISPRYHGESQSRGKYQNFANSAHMLPTCIRSIFLWPVSSAGRSIVLTTWFSTGAMVWCGTLLAQLQASSGSSICVGGAGPRRCIGTYGGSSTELGDGLSPEAEDPSE